MTNSIFKTLYTTTIISIETSAISTSSKSDSKYSTSECSADYRYLRRENLRFKN